MTSSETDRLQPDYCAERLRALGDPLRLRIVALLRQGEMTVGDIAQFLDVELVNASHHLQNLRHAGLVTPRREGRFIYYSLHKDLLPGGQRKSRQLLDLGCCRIELPKQN
ncbi:MAG: ArsR/SmtB family transcription factor [Pirellulaceae bacterium]